MDKLTLKNLLETYALSGSGFPAIVELAKQSNKFRLNRGVLSSLSPAILVEQGITDYFAIQFPRGFVAQSAQDIIDSDLPVHKYHIEILENDALANLDIIIASRHSGTVDVLRSMYGDHIPVLDIVTEDDIAGKLVVGTLPPNLLGVVGGYIAVTIRDFDYTVDGDLQGNELAERLQIAKKAIKVHRCKYLVYTYHLDIDPVYGAASHKFFSCAKDAYDYAKQNKNNYLSQFKIRTDKKIYHLDGSGPCGYFSDDDFRKMDEILDEFSQKNI